MSVADDFRTRCRQVLRDLDVQGSCTAAVPFPGDLLVGDLNAVLDEMREQGWYVRHDSSRLEARFYTRAYLHRVVDDTLKHRLAALEAQREALEEQLQHLEEQVSEVEDHAQAQRVQIDAGQFPL